MIMITGWSQKLDGIAFLADTDDFATAHRLMVEDWNNRFTDQTKIVETPTNTYLLFAEVEESAIADFEDEVPRREGWQLISEEVAVGSVLQSMPW